MPSRDRAIPSAVATFGEGNTTTRHRHACIDERSKMSRRRAARIGDRFGSFCHRPARDFERNHVPPSGTTDQRSGTDAQSSGTGVLVSGTRVRASESDGLSSGTDEPTRENDGRSWDMSVTSAEPTFSTPEHVRGRASSVIHHVEATSSAAEQACVRAEPPSRQGNGRCSLWTSCLARGPHGHVCGTNSPA